MHHNQLGRIFGRIFQYQHVSFTQSHKKTLILSDTDTPVACTVEDIQLETIYLNNCAIFLKTYN